MTLVANADQGEQHFSTTWCKHEWEQDEEAPPGAKQWAGKRWEATDPGSFEQVEEACTPPCSPNDLFAAVFSDPRRREKKSRRRFYEHPDSSRRAIRAPLWWSRITQFAAMGPDHAFLSRARLVPKRSR